MVEYFTKTIAALSLILFCLVILQSCDRNSESKIAVESFFNEADKSNFKLSPNGNFVSFIEQTGDVPNLYVMDLETDEISKITFEDNPEEGIRFSFWANDNELIYFKRKQFNDSLRLMMVNRHTHFTRYLIPPSIVNLKWIGPLKINKDDELLIGLNSRDSSVFDVYRLNIYDSSLRMVAQNPGNITDWFPCDKGKIKLAIASDGPNESILYRENEESNFKSIIKNNFRTSIRPLGFSAKVGGRIYALSNEKRDKKALVEIDIETGREVELLFSHEEVDVEDGRYSQERGVVDYATYNAHKPERFFLNKDMEQVFAKIDHHLPGFIIDLEGNDSSLTKFLIRAYTDVDPGTFYFYDVKKDKLKSLGKVNSALNLEQLSPTKSIYYTTEDGYKINAYLTIPKGSKSLKHPVIVIPHNGPSSRAVWGYNAEVQFLASKGYAVFQPNYRGSTGYGKAFWTSGFKEWGKNVQKDIRDGVKWLIDEGIADSDRIGIYGYNFGGYSALHAAIFSSDMYSCAASYSGMTNLYTYLREFPPYYLPYMEMFYDMVGNPRSDGDYLRAYSPIFHTDKVKIPLFIAQGGRDVRNNVNETNHFVKELRKNGVQVKYMLKDNEGGYFRKEENKMSFYTELGQFFDKNLKKKNVN